METGKPLIEHLKTVQKEVHRDNRGQTSDTLSEVKPKT